MHFIQITFHMTLNQFLRCCSFIEETPIKEPPFQHHQRSSRKQPQQHIIDASLCRNSHRDRMCRSVCRRDRRTFVTYDDALRNFVRAPKHRSLRRPRRCDWYTYYICLYMAHVEYSTLAECHPPQRIHMLHPFQATRAQCIHAPRLHAFHTSAKAAPRVCWNTKSAAANVTWGSENYYMVLLNASRCLNTLLAFDLMTCGEQNGIIVRRHKGDA